MNLSRRVFCGAAGLGTFQFLSPSFNNISFGAGSEKHSNHLRVIAYNVYACKGWPSDRELAKKVISKGQMANRLADELALYDPDIITFSESPSKEIVQKVATRLGMSFVTFPSGIAWPGTLLTKYKIIDSQNAPLLDPPRPKDLFTRHWGRAIVQLPQGEKLIVHSAHLMPGPDPKVRIREIGKMLLSMKKDFEANRSMLLMGDLNHGPDTKEFEMLLKAGWVDTFKQVGSGKGKTIKADSPEHRIDYVMAAGPITKQIVASRPLFEGAFRVSPDDKRSFALSDHLPQYAEFELK